MSIFDDEQIIKRRLQIDGEGVGDERKVNLLLKTFTRWASSTDESADYHFGSLMSNCEFSVLKSELSERMIDEELKNYKKASDNIAERIELVKEQIDQAKEQEKSAKEIRRNKLEYSSMARLIKKEPDRKEIVKKHEALKEELQKKEEQFQKVNLKLENRRKDFASFMLLTQELLKDINAESNGSNNELDVEAALDEGDDDMMIE